MAEYCRVSNTRPVRMNLPNILHKLTFSTEIVNVMHHSLEEQKQLSPAILEYYYLYDLIKHHIFINYQEVTNNWIQQV